MDTTKPSKSVPDIDDMKNRSGRQTDDNIDDLGRDTRDNNADKRRHPQTDERKSG